MSGAGATVAGRAGLRLGAVIVAAGAGTRLGGVAKALLPVGDTTFLGAIARTARVAGVAAADTVVVVGEPFGAAVAAAVARLGAGVVWNPEPARGMASSIALGFAALGHLDAPPGPGALAAALLWPVDHPHVRAATIAALAAALAAAPGAVDAAIPSCRGQGGHPPLVARALWPAMARCDLGGGGARGVLRAARAVPVEVDDDGVLRDVDTPADRPGSA